MFPGRVYSVKAGVGTYSVTVIDYRESEKLHAAIPKAESFTDPRYWQIDIQASIQYAATKLSTAAGLEGHLRRVALHRSRRRTSAAVVESGQHAYFRLYLPAREPSLHRGGDGAAGLSAARTVPAEPELPGRKGRARALQRDLLQPSSASAGEGWWGWTWGRWRRWAWWRGRRRRSAERRTEAVTSYP